MLTRTENEWKSEVENLTGEIKELCIGIRELSRQAEILKSEIRKVEQEINALSQTPLTDADSSECSRERMSQLKQQEANLQNKLLETKNKISELESELHERIEDGEKMEDELEIAIDKHLGESIQLQKTETERFSSEILLAAHSWERGAHFLEMLLAKLKRSIESAKECLGELVRSRHEEFVSQIASQRFTQRGFNLFPPPIPSSVGEPWRARLGLEPVPMGLMDGCSIPSLHTEPLDFRTRWTFGPSLYTGEDPFAPSLFTRMNMAIYGFGSPMTTSLSFGTRNTLFPSEEVGPSFITGCSGLSFQTGPTRTNLEPISGISNISNFPTLCTGGGSASFSSPVSSIAGQSSFCMLGS